MDRLWAFIFSHPRVFAGQQGFLRKIRRLNDAQAERLAAVLALMFRELEIEDGRERTKTPTLH